jgi:hypothetical protein
VEAGNRPSSSRVLFLAGALFFSGFAGSVQRDRRHGVKEGGSRLLAGGRSFSAVIGGPALVSTGGKITISSPARRISDVSGEKIEENARLQIRPKFSWRELRNFTKIL